jgi:hypothetical protein
MSDVFDLEPFGVECKCDDPSCQRMLKQYHSIYEKYVVATQECKTVSNQNKALSFDVSYKIAALDLQIKQLQQCYQREVAVVHALQGNLEYDKSFLSDQTVCSNCIGHRNALLVQRKYVCSEYENLKARHDQINEILEQCKADVMAERMENGKLRAKYWRNNDPFWNNKEIQMLRSERDKAVAEAAELKKTIVLLRQDKEQNKHRYITATGIIETLQSELCSVRAERDVLKGRRLGSDQDDEARIRFDAAVNHFRQMAESCGMKRDSSRLEDGVRQ